MIHDQSVVPASMFARVPMVRSRAIEASRQTAEAVRKQVEHEVAKEPVKLQGQIAHMHGMIK